MKQGPQEHHVGVSWMRHLLEDVCGCPQAPCGLIVQDQAQDTCPHHSPAAQKPMRQSHLSTDCPVLEQ